MSSIVSEEMPKGEWEECVLQGCGLMFFRYPYGHKSYSIGDKIGVCPLCVFNKKTENGTLPKARHDIEEYHGKSVDSKPEKDTL